MTNLALTLTITLLTYLTLLTLAWLNKTGKLQPIKTYLQKYPPH